MAEPRSPLDDLGLHRVAMTLCADCLDGSGGECHVPGCALWMNRAPDVPIRDKTEDVVALEAEVAAAREALKSADKALADARNGLDLGLGCAREIENDYAGRPSSRRSGMANAYLERARTAHASVRAALSEDSSGG